MLIIPEIYYSLTWLRPVFFIVLFHINLYYTVVLFPSNHLFLTYLSVYMLHSLSGIETSGGERLFSSCLCITGTWYYLAHSSCLKKVEFSVYGYHCLAVSMWYCVVVSMWWWFFLCEAMVVIVTVSVTYYVWLYLGWFLVSLLCVILWQYW